MGENQDYFKIRFSDIGDVGDNVIGSVFCFHR